MAQNAVLSELLHLHPELERHLDQTEFSTRDFIVRPDQAIENVVFPVSGLVATVMAVGSDFVEAGMIGADGAIGGSVVLGGRRHPTFALGCIPGAAHVLPAAVLFNLAKDDETVRTLFFRSESWLLVQAQQIAACNGKHAVSQRFCHWLLRAADIHGNESLFATQELIAQLLGVQRASISPCASELQDKGYIKYSRGVISIIDREMLEAQACECYRMIRKRRPGL